MIQPELPLGSFGAPSATESKMDNEDSENQASPLSEKEDISSASTQVHTGGGDFIGRDQSVQGDLVQGDKVAGDKITTGDITDNIGVVIGSGATSNITIIHGAPLPRIPLQRPPHAEHFVGREDELAWLLDNIQLGNVITLCGPGGIGKTALAAEAVWHLAPGNKPPERFPDGIIFHSFYNQPQAALALEHIARSFGEEPDTVG